MRILIIKLSPIEAITSSMFRTLAIAKGLTEQGNQLDMLVLPLGSVHTLGGGKYDFFENINVIRTGRNEMYNKIVEQSGKKNLKSFLKKTTLNILRSVWHKFSIYDGTLNVAKKLDINILPTKEYDIIISSSDPKTSHIAMKKFILQGLKYRRWIQYWGDPLSIDITGKSIYPKWLLRHFERKLLNGADKIVYVSPFTLDAQKKIFPEYARYMEFLPVSYIEKKVYSKTNNDKFIIDYYGNYTSTVRNIMPFYHACKQLGDKIHANIVGDSDLILEDDANISVYPRGIIDEFEKKTDLLVCILNNKGTQIPGKIYHAAGTNKKILVVIDGDNQSEMKKYLESFKRYIMCDNNVEAIKNTILSIMNDKREYMPSEYLNYKNITELFVK